jgi:hypothetical protein
MKLLYNVAKSLDNDDFKDHMIKKTISFYDSGKAIHHDNALIDYSIKVSRVDIKLFILSYFLQNIGEYKLQLKLESEIEDFLNFEPKKSLLNIILFIQLNLIGDNQLSHFLHLNKLTSIIPKDLVLLSKNLNDFDRHNVSNEEAIFIGPMADVNDLKLYLDKTMLLPNPTLKTLETISNFNSLKSYLFFRNPRIEDSIINPIKRINFKPTIILEKNNAFLDFLRLMHLKNKMSIRILSKYSFLFHKYTYNYVTFNGINFFLASIILNNFNSFKVIKVTGVSFFTSNSNYNNDYIKDRLINENDIQKNIIWLLNNYSNHNLIQNFILLKKLYKLKIIEPIGYSKDVLSLSFQEYAEALEHNFGNRD